MKKCAIIAALIILLSFAACATAVSPVSQTTETPANKNNDQKHTTSPSDNKSKTRTKKMSEYQDVQDFINDISIKHKLDKKTITKAFDSSHFDNKVIELMNMPSEKKYWPEYSSKLISKERIDNGKKYIKDNKAALDGAYMRWGVPPNAVSAIIGIESNYGKVEIKRTALTGLATLAFEYPRRSKYFKEELISLFILADKEKTDPLSYKGSYAGAVGIPQFMPSNILRYGKDGDGDGQIDIVSSHNDAIESVAFYLKEHGWERDKNTIALVTLKQSLPDSDFGISSCDIKKRATVKTLKSKGVVFNKTYPDNASGILAKLDKENNGFVPVVFFENACPIHRYNGNIKYTAAVALLAEMLNEAE
ncbi:MAG: lytic murein transglycosylase [Deferribacteraceae bacterium]|jgi:membrane-bound lytic murein transglycosylase B|nr:lytic murein transglycosylase [Deferribacteraceae bacterium]